MLSPKTRAPTRPGTAKRRNAKPNLLIHEAQQGCRDATYEPSRFPVAVPYSSPHRATPAYVVVTSSDLDTSRNKASVSGLSWISRKPNAVNRLGICYSRASTCASLRLGRGSNGGLCLRRLGLELAAGGVKRPFAHWRAVAAPDVEPDNSGSNSSRKPKERKNRTQCCQSLRQLLLKRARGLDTDQRGKVLILFDSGGSNGDAEQQSWNSALPAIPAVSIVPLDLTIWGRVDSGRHRTSLQ